MASRIALKNPQREQHIYGARTVVAIGGVVMLLALLVTRYYTLQIRDYETYSTALRTQPRTAAATAAKAGTDLRSQWHPAGRQPAELYALADCRAR